MRTLRIFALAAALAMTMAGCIFDSPETTTDGPVLGDAGTSGCKLESGLTPRSLIDGNMIEAIAYDNAVTIIHHDAQYQCNADISWELQINGEELLLREVDKSVEVTRCMCPVDLSIDINNLTAGKTYHVTVWDEFETKMFGEVWVTVGNCDAQCVVPEDCWNYPELPRLDCPGNWACLEGLCNWYCDDVPTGCYGDADCPDGFQCVFYTVALDGTTDPEPGMPTEKMVAYQCTSDAECPEGMYCEIQDCGCPEGADCDCAYWGYCAGQVWPTEGVCEPIVVNNECRSDADCGSGYHCEFAYPVPADASGAAQEADPMPPIDQCMCTEEWAPVCGYDNVTYSNSCFAYCAGVEIAYDGECGGGQGIGYCVPDENPGCYSDADCPDGYVCELTDWCAGTDENGDGLIDPTWCMGQCVPGMVDSCEAMGGFCYPMTEDGNCPADSEWMYGNAYPEGLCADGSICCIPSHQECVNDSDCYDIYGDVPSDPATGVAARWTCVDGTCQAQTECGVFECYSDADCRAGYMCVGTGYCDDAGYCCESTMCVYNGGNRCADDVPCAEGEQCIDGVCVPVEQGCDASGACPEGYVCMNGVCVTDGCYCTQEWAPVCGDDGNTYSNACMAKCAGVGIAYEGECEITDPACSADDDCADGYVCMNGVCVYQQEECRIDDTGMCVCGGFAGFMCPAGLACVYDDPNCSPDAGGADCMGHCYAVPDECVCDAMYAPVCGSDGITYSNKCMATCAGVQPMYDGECVNR